MKVRIRVKQVPAKLLSKGSKPTKRKVVVHLPEKVLKKL